MSPAADPNAWILENVNLDRLAEPCLADFRNLAKKKPVYEKRFPETRHGAQGGRGGQRNEKFTLGFSKAIAQADDGISLTSAKRSVRIGIRIGDAVEHRIATSTILRPAFWRAKMVLYALTYHDQADQLRILDLIESGKAADVAEAEVLLKLRTTPPANWEQEFRVEKKRVKAMERKGRDALWVWGAETGQVEAALGAPAAPPEIDKYLSAAELAAAKLPGLPASKKGMLALAERRGWRYIESPARGGTTRLYAIADLPVDAKRRIMRGRKIAEEQLGRLKVLRKSAGEMIVPTIEVIGTGVDAGATHG